MTWVIALLLRPFAALLVFGLAAFVAYVLLARVIPAGRVKRLLYDRTLQKRYPWRFAALGLIACYGTIALVGYLGT